MNKRNVFALLVAAAAVAGFALWNRTGSEDEARRGVSGQGTALSVVVPSSLSDTAKMGERAFNAVCAACHGKNAAGTDAGPPLIHRIYEPSHHGDYAFEMAVANGVRAHHWKFGNMPPQPGLTRADVATIVAYVRELQRATGIN